ncbi:hypothetical protein Bca4012_047792 [Brassica carinata]
MGFPPTHMSDGSQRHVCGKKGSSRCFHEWPKARHRVPVRRRGYCGEKQILTVELDKPREMWTVGWGSLGDNIIIN